MGSIPRWLYKQMISGKAHSCKDLSNEATTYNA